MCGLLVGEMYLPNFPSQPYEDYEVNQPSSWWLDIFFFRYSKAMRKNSVFLQVFPLTNPILVPISMNHLKQCCFSLHFGWFTRHCWWIYLLSSHQSCGSLFNIPTCAGQYTQVYMILYIYNFPFIYLYIIYNSGAYIHTYIYTYIIIVI